MTRRERAIAIPARTASECLLLMVAGEELSWLSRWQDDERTCARSTKI